MTDFANSSACAIMGTLAKALADTFAVPRNGSVAVAADPAHAIELLAAGRPGGIAIVLFYTGDASAGDGTLPEDTLVEGQLNIGVVRSKGLAARPNASVPDALADAEALRSFLARLVAAEALTGVYEYAGMAALQNHAGEFLHGYALTYKILYAYTV